VKVDNRFNNASIQITVSFDPIQQEEHVFVTYKECIDIGPDANISDAARAFEAQIRSLTGDVMPDNLQTLINRMKED
jgi:hypothetical protein